jgi:hypothetical protein
LTINEEERGVRKSVLCWGILAVSLTACGSKQAPQSNAASNQASNQASNAAIPPPSAASQRIPAKSDKPKLPKSADASLHSLTPAQLIRKLDDCAADKNCTSDDAVMTELWSRGYCNTDAQGHIGKCTPEEIADDKQATAALSNMH